MFESPTTQHTKQYLMLQKASIKRGLRNPSHAALVNKLRTDASVRCFDFKISASKHPANIQVTSRFPHCYVTLYSHRSRSVSER